jgi:hypothetical protein
MFKQLLRVQLPGQLDKDLAGIGGLDIGDTSAQLGVQPAQLVDTYYLLKFR